MKKTVLLLLMFWSLPTLAEKNWQAVDGSSHSLDEFIGNGYWTVVNVWATRCPPCLEELPDLGAFHDRYADSNARVLGLAISFPDMGRADAGDVEDFMQDYLIEFPVLLADANSAGLVLGQRLTAVPSSVVFDPQGRRVTNWRGSITLPQLIQRLREHGWQEHGSE